jgi:hypothetical protein
MSQLSAVYTVTDFLTGMGHENELMRTSTRFAGMVEEQFFMAVGKGTLAQLWVGHGDNCKG